MGATRRYGVPSRVRCDQGRENIRVGQYMLENHVEASLFEVQSITNALSASAEICTAVQRCFIIECFTYLRTAVY